MIEGVVVTPLKIIPVDQGNVLHAMRRSDPEFLTFGEAYFSEVKEGAIKGWKKHRQMILNLIVVVGKIRLVVFDDRLESDTRGDYFDIVLSPSDNYSRLTIYPELWVAFEGIGVGSNLLLNLASIEHDPTEAENIPVATGKIIYPTFQR